MVYAKDEFENIGTSETIVFILTEPFPTTWFVATIAIAITSGSVLAIYYFKKPIRKGSSNQHRQTKP